ncbi:SpdD-like protein [Streptomyces boluensis]|uniref:SpdD-like protein n=1 Tax=Streptomyces boluensis TaxID=1775135 RepID=A0A964XJM8_9ACTN|nr:SpdD-like protein [Streptomyces boluensis]NBE51325.1 SpdD-like protein [Streptomyces boluensis]
MLRPKIPTNLQPTARVTPPTVIEPTTVARHYPVAPATAQPNRPTVQLTPGALVTLVAGGTTAVLVLGAVLVSLLLAVAITAASTAITALVIRSLMNENTKRR